MVLQTKIISKKEKTQLENHPHSSPQTQNQPKAPRASDNEYGPKNICGLQLKHRELTTTYKNTNKTSTSLPKKTSTTPLNQLSFIKCSKNTQTPTENTSATTTHHHTNLHLHSLPQPFRSTYDTTTTNNHAKSM